MYPQQVQSQQNFLRKSEPQRELRRKRPEEVGEFEENRSGGLDKSVSEWHHANARRVRHNEEGERSRSVSTNKVTNWEISRDVPEIYFRLCMVGGNRSGEDAKKVCMLVK